MPVIATVCIVALLNAVGACAVSSSGAKDWLIAPGSIAPRPGLSAHFGGFTNIEAGRESGRLAPGPLPDPLAFAEFHAGEIPSDAFSATGPDLRFDGESTGRSAAPPGGTQPDAERPGLICIRNLSPVLFALEAGLRLEYCEAGNASRAAALVATIAGIRAGSHSTALPEYSDETIQIRAATPAELRKSVGPIEISIDAGRSARLAGWRLASPRMRFAYDLAATSHTINTDERAHPLPRRFPAGEFYCLLTREALYLMYVIRNDPGRLLSVRIQNPAALREARAAFEAIPGLLATHITNSGVHEFQAGEIYFRGQSLELSADTAERPDEFFEIASGSQDAIASIRLSGESASGAPHPALEREIFLFAHSTRLLTRNANFRFTRSLRFRAGAQAQEIVYRLDEMPAGVAPRRSYAPSAAGETPARTAGLKLNTVCRRDFAAFARLCSNPGLTPRFALALENRRRFGEHASQTRTLCTPADFSLSEFNPTGVHLPAENRIARDGKFVEFEVRRDCRADAVHFRVGDILLDPGAAVLHAGQTLLFAAARDPGRYLDASTGHFARIALFSAPALGSARAGDPIIAYGAAGNDQDPSKYETILRTDSRKIEYWTGTGDAAVTGTTLQKMFRAVHSFEFDSTAREFFASGPGRGLRPDLCAHNAMSPGVPGRSAASPVNAAGTHSDIAPALQVRLSEILPAGGYTIDGRPRASEEFIEFEIDAARAADNRPRGWELRITKETNAAPPHNRSVAQRVRFPAPENRGRFVLRRAASRCFAAPVDGLAAVLGRLSLPNGAALYELLPLTTGLFAPADQFHIDAARYAKLDRPGRQRASISRRFADSSFEEFWRATDGATGVSPYCGHATMATPGAESAFAPFLYRESQRPHQLRLFSAGETLSLRIRLGENLQAPRTDHNLIVTHGQRIEPERLDPDAFAAGPRLLYSIESGGRILKTGERFAHNVPLVIQSVAAAPPAGQPEWIRLCSPDGFSPDAFAVTNDGKNPATADQVELRVADAHSSDRIVPFALRRPTVGPLFASLRTNEAELAPGDCALLVDPDYNGEPLPAGDRDALLWTVADSSSIGNGLSPGEGLRIYVARGPGPSAVILASFGRPDLPDPFEISVAGGRYVSRIADLSERIFFDEAHLFEIRAPD